MSLKTRLTKELDALASLAGSGGACQLLRLDVDGGRLEAEMTAVDQLACAFDRTAYVTDKRANASVDDLKQLAEDLASRLTYLLETISPVEIDKEECIVQMRSNPPQKDDDGTKYYELVVSRSEISLCRYAKTPGQPRQLVSASVTREVFARLGRDFVEAA